MMFKQKRYFGGSKQITSGFCFIELIIFPAGVALEKFINYKQQQRWHTYQSI
jgi:hypothetical protein